MIHVTNANSAMIQVNEMPFDVIFIDLSFPSNCYEICRGLKKAQEIHHKRMPIVIALTSYLNTKLEDHCLKQGFDFIKEVPFNISWFENSVLIEVVQKMNNDEQEMHSLPDLQMQKVMSHKMPKYKRRIHIINEEDEEITPKNKHFI